MDIQWYPGHMVKSKRLLKENLKLVQAVIELLDARVPMSSKNPEFDEILKDKFRICVLNKSDLAEKAATREWVKYYQNLNLRCIAVNSLSGEGIPKVIRTLSSIQNSRKNARIRRMVLPVRVMVIGIPNVGKSAFINKLVGKATAKTGDKPGVTRGKQWIRIRKGIELLDTPGVLWPKLTGEGVGFKLAALNAIGENAYDRVELVLKLLEYLQENYPKQLSERYDLMVDDYTPEQLLQEIGLKKGCLQKGNEVDLHSTAAIVLKEFRTGKITRLTLDGLPENEKRRN
ncbi:MAG: ribosome biosis GTPase [Clostridia bacterium]|nr:ribosome biosis GTP-binding protein YlqF [Clostridiales bacterium]MDK2984727.1 ribosome biosis GTPase [Clostridia bacterium]